MAQVPLSNQQNHKRVKVYELRNNDWFDFGTGYCSAAFVFDDATSSEEPRVLVHSEKDTDCTILNTKIYAIDGFRQQSGTLILWKEPRTSIDMALSFQDSDACDLIWNFVDTMQQQNRIPQSHYDTASDDIPTEPHTPAEAHTPISLPSPSLGSLQEIEIQMRALQNTDPGRDALTKYVLAEEYIQKLVPLVEMAEDIEDLAGLHHLCNIMKSLILLNDTTIIELVVSDDLVMGVVGALEYDPDFPCHKANHRQWLAKDGRYREVVRIDDDTRKKIHSTYRLQYLKDVVLARILDDPTFSVLNSLIFFNQVDIVQHLQSNPIFLNELFGIFDSQENDERRKKDAVLFIQQCCAIAKSLQPNARQQLLDIFLSHGLLTVIKFALGHSDSSVRVGATDVLVSMIDHDPQMIRQTIFRQISEKQTPLTDSLIDLLLVESDLGVKAQVSDAIKVLLDPSHNSGHPDTTHKPPQTENADKSRFADPQQMAFVRDFYEKSSAKKLFKPLIDLKDRQDTNFSVQEVSLFIYLIEILCFFVRQHTCFSKYFIQSEDLGQRVAYLLLSPEKYLKLGVVKFFRGLVGVQQEFYNQYITRGNLLEPVLDLIIESMPRDTLLISAALELFNFINREKITHLISYLVESCREKLMKITHVEIFDNLISRYDSTQGFTIVFADAENETVTRPRQIQSGRWESGIKDLDAREEEYFNTSDEEDCNNGYPSPPPHSNLSASPSKPLVDYLSDEDDEMLDCNEVHENSRRTHEKVIHRHPLDSPISSSNHPPNPSISSSPITPEKLSEKRRREADEIDELDKLSQVSKRRNSSGTPATNGILRRKKQFSGNPATNSVKTKIAISISSTVKRSMENIKTRDSSTDINVVNKLTSKDNESDNS